MKMMGLRSLLFVPALLFASTFPAGAQQKVTPPPQIPYGAPISLGQAQKVMAGAEAEAKTNKLNVVIAILDSGAHLVMLQRLDGAQLGSLENALDKARSAVFFRRPTKVFQDRVGQPGSANMRLLGLRGANIIEGGWPIVMGGKVVGAIGVSGALVEQDSQVARAGINALTK
jgi:uncharacterized protein GlcG (DUF336 family)